MVIIAGANRLCRRWNRKCAEEHGKKTGVEPATVTAYGYNPLAPTLPLDDMYREDGAAVPDVSLRLSAGMRLRLVHRFGTYMKHTVGVLRETGAHYLLMEMASDPEDEATTPFSEFEYAWLPRCFYQWQDAHGEHHQLLQFPVAPVYAVTYMARVGRSTGVSGTQRNRFFRMEAVG